GGPFPSRADLAPALSCARAEACARARLGRFGVARFSFRVLRFTSSAVRQHAPVVALSIVALARRPRAAVPYLLWFAPFVVLHALWRVPYDAWWHARFVLPGLPALFLLAALGGASLHDALRTSVLRLAMAGSVLTAYVVFCVTST